MKLKQPLYPLLAISVLLSGCILRDKYESIINNGFLLPNQSETRITEQETVYIFCGEGDIQEYIDKGWKVIETEEEEVPCSWKTGKARPGCNLKDKGCKISVPDQMGAQIKYILEKDTTIKDQD